MRIHGLHVQGLRAPREMVGLELDSGYNAIVADPEGRDGFAALLRALLFPASYLGSYADWVDPHAEIPPRAGLAFSLGADLYRLIVDFARERLILGRYDGKRAGYARVSVDAAEIAVHLGAAGMPPREQFLPLLWCGVLIEAGQAPGKDATQLREERAGLEAELYEAAARERDIAELEARLREVAAAREQVVALERRGKADRDALEQCQPLGEALDGLDVQLGKYRELEDKRDADRRAVELARQDLLAERARLRAVPAGQRVWMLLGAALGAAGTLAGSLVHPLLIAVGLVGVGMALVSLGVARSARRRTGNVEARLAALRVRERALERHFEAEGARVRALLRSLELDGPAELEEAATRYRGLLERIESNREELERARGALPERAGEERELEMRLEDARAAPGVEELRQRLIELGTEEEEPTTLTQIDAASATLAAERAAAAWTGSSIAEIWTHCAPALPLYLRSLTGGVVTGASSEGSEWLVRMADGERRIADLPTGLRQRVAVALRLALLEGLAKSRRFPVVFAIDELELEADALDPLARALRRLSSACQVVLIAGDRSPWAERGAHLHAVG